MKKLDKILHDLEWGTDIEGKEHAHKALSREDVEFLISNTQVLCKLLKNLELLSWSLVDTPFFTGKDIARAIEYSIEKVLQETGISPEELLGYVEKNM